MALPADLFLQAWRPSAYVISGSINFLGMFLIGMLFGYVVVRYPLCILCVTHKHNSRHVFLSLLLSFSLSQDGLGQFCFLIFVIYCFVSAAFLIFLVPETKGKTMVDIMKDFNKLNYRSSADVKKTHVSLETKC